MDKIKKFLQNGLSNITMIDLVVILLVNIILVTFLLSIDFGKHFMLTIIVLGVFNYWWPKFFKKNEIDKP